MDITTLPSGLFRTLLELWSVFQKTYVTVFDWFGRTAMGGDGTLIEVMFGFGLFAVIILMIVKFLNPLS